MHGVIVVIRNWWLIGLRGVLALLFGVLTLLYPSASLAAVIVLFGAYATVAGVLMIAAAVVHRRDRPYWGAFVTSGALSILIGVVTFVTPHLTALALLYVVATWAILTGIGEIVAAVRLREEITGEWLLGVAGALSVLLGVVLFAFPVTAGLALVQWIGAYWAVFGVVLIALAFRLRTLARGEIPIM